ncbi:uncharacterized protein SOCEGT47_078600 [Sorangium cellulosum]|uniref:asparagine synthase (glutamine-hydrolyzing) n=1 Tax=Sorangium cellulosum TaxID=56 RepID=A0A4P2QD52_SORCE|nr:asparagine synthetase B [Sorangium cellulosum]AUX27276.1 uncharacterized protein SOCEGT47_078600 [Sorangium cellulosum]
MCGIVGLVALGDEELGPRDVRAVDAAVTRLFARGPDGEGRLARRGVDLRFRRLAINDPSQAGLQPFQSEDGTVAVLVNGEIFNHHALRAAVGSGHRWRSGSDCEVLLPLYRAHGLAALERLGGMFAAVVVDLAERKVHLARDRFGIKPMFYSVRGGRIAVASEVSALTSLVEAPAGIDWGAALSDPWFARYPCLSWPDPARWYAGAESVRPGEVVTISMTDGRVSTRRWWRLGACLAGSTGAEGGPAATTPAEAPVAAYREALERSVADCLSGEADVALFLSGGIDSVAIAALARAGGARPLCVTSSAPAAELSGDLGAAHAAADALGLPLASWAPSDVWPKLDADLWTGLLAITENPLTGPEQLYKMAIYVGLARSHRGVRVTLSGQGSDEFNGGYSTLFAPPGGGWDDFLTAVDLLAGEISAHRTIDLAAHWNRDLGAPVVRGRPRPPEATALPGDRGWRDYITSKCRDLELFNLWNEDRTAAAVSMENRVPFLDHPVVLTSARLGLDPALAARWLYDKRVLRAAVGPLLPEALAVREKVPFFYGRGAALAAREMASLLGADGGRLLEAALDGSPAAREWLDADALRAAALRVIEDPQARGWEGVLRVVNLALLDGLVTHRIQPPQIVPGAGA